MPAERQYRPEASERATNLRRSPRSFAEAFQAAGYPRTRSIDPAESEVRSLKKSDGASVLGASGGEDACSTTPGTLKSVRRLYGRAAQQLSAARFADGQIFQMHFSGPFVAQRSFLTRATRTSSLSVYQRSSACDGALRRCFGRLLWNSEAAAESREPR